jgi:hypothetical protein
MSIANIPNTILSELTLTVPLSGATTLPLTIKLQKINGLVEISWDSLTFTATTNNEILLTLPLPVEYRPSAQQIRSIGCTSGGSPVFTDITITAGGVVNFTRYGLNWSGACRLTSNTIVFNQ